MTAWPRLQRRPFPSPRYRRGRSGRTEKMNEGSSQVHVAASELSRLAEQLQAMLARFKV